MVEPMKQPNIERLLEFQHLLLKFSHIERRLKRKHVDDNFIPENDTEHSYNLALTAWFLASHFPKLDEAKVIKLSLVHDLVEIHAGDTYVYAKAELLASKPAREAAALKQLQAEWQDFSEMTESIKEYEKRDTAEAKFVYALDKVMAVMLIYTNDGFTFREDNITVKMLEEAHRHRVALSPEILPYYDELMNLLLQSPHLISPE
jgi:putative hydrolase of HD superfamily